MLHGAEVTRAQDQQRGVVGEGDDLLDAVTGQVMGCHVDLGSRLVRDQGAALEHAGREALQGTVGDQQERALGQVAGRHVDDVEPDAETQRLLCGIPHAGVAALGPVDSDDDRAVFSWLRVHHRLLSVRSSPSIVARRRAPGPGHRSSVVGPMALATRRVSRERGRRRRCDGGRGGRSA